MAKQSKDKIIVSLSLSKELVEVLNVFKNRSKLIEEILTELLLNLSPAEMLELIQTMTNGGSIVEFLIRKKCEELGKIQVDKSKVEIKQAEKSEPEIVVEKKKSNKGINPQDWWG
ncbi:MAG: hypothetical protein GXO21_04295 [Aquificae bacterium]|nr:hypothetical protein [Aquificota bacterium]